MRLRKLLPLAAALVVAATGTACTQAGGTSGGQNRVTGFRVMVPNTPGGGYDVTARTSAKAMEEAGLARNVEVFNLPGAGGTVGLGRLVGEKGNGKLAMQMGLGVVGSVYTNKSPSTLQDTTPIAKLIEEPDIVVVSKNSKYTDIKQLIEAWKADPGAVPVGGGSSPGGPDHLAPMLVADAIGLEPKKVNYVPFDGGGELLASVLGNKVAFGVSGVGEYMDQIKAGELRVLAVTSKDRVSGVDAPTLKESGVDVEFTNWRGVVAPPGISDADKQAMIDLYTKLHASEQWKQALAKNGWHDAFSTGDEFASFLQKENDRVGGVLKALGLTA
ncbi:putative tricarboxylic transport membrane protein [Actinokineospora alba]|uniref:Putative tricarboxylic transport membrane protein n=1 Tax=Actinokineospora alba TaxID=504798 RepID=A0A1H0G814_9PSEU|nr:tripartite tricarboxylate transporter substrate-binding protein [Actinokineospora alba]TDP69800.1 putative tricarboxylic transport membrane protein [Actinokineospora alba]SDI08441.1 putative tricarboxylic transport membrane protein [Actinokineospora alba]SDO03037.1 putative tricarboxylic transport membrane protein [Actinokineospora alba]